MKLFLKIDVLAARAPTTVFESTCAGVSMQVTKATREAANCPPGGVPQPITIANGVVKPPSGKAGPGLSAPTAR